LRTIALFLAWLFLATWNSAAFAHEMRPAYLALHEIRSGEFSVLWKVPAMGDLRLGIDAELPENCKPSAEPVRSIQDNAYLVRWTAECSGGLKGQTIAIDGMKATLTEALVRIEYEDGSIEIARLMPDTPSFTVSGAQSSGQVAATYFHLGVDHILTGIDHLLFVLALILLINDRWVLAKTITAFTVAHSITLAGASLGYFSLPQKPVEAAIALSIAFVASELLKMKPGERRLSEARPWLVALAFGLLHGFGFAGALKETGLPQTDIPLALLTFNLGVEAGQLMFVAAVLISFGLFQTLVKLPVVPARRLASYAIGTVATIWLLSRLAAFVS
jgi:hydrogenase/urease accessory protein HupE